jgi:hydrogenase maturation protease
MTPKARVIGIGQRAAGDDGVGYAVLDRLRNLGLTNEIDVIPISDGSGLIPWLATLAPVVVVDAILADPPGQVLTLAPDEIGSAGPAPVSSHGLGAGQAIQLARILMPAEISPWIRFVAVSIGRPDEYAYGLSPAVAAAVGPAAERVLALLAAAPPGQWEAPRRDTARADHLAP